MFDILNLIIVYNNKKGYVHILTTLYTYFTPFDEFRKIC